MPVAFSVSDVFAADVAHLVAADAGEFIATARFDEACVAAGTGAFDGHAHCQLHLSP